MEESVFPASFAKANARSALVAKILIVIGCVLLLLSIAVLIGWKLGLVTFYSYKVKR